MELYLHSPMWLDVVILKHANFTFIFYHRVRSSVSQVCGPEHILVCKISGIIFVAFICNNVYFYLTLIHLFIDYKRRAPWILGHTYENVRKYWHFSRNPLITFRYILGRWTTQIFSFVKICILSSGALRQHILERN